jgi:hypothetical protein
MEMITSLFCSSALLPIPQAISQKPLREGLQNRNFEYHLLLLLSNESLSSQHM